MFYPIVASVAVFSLWATKQIKGVGDKIFGPIPAYKGFNLNPLSAPKAPGQFSVNLPFLAAVVGLLFGAGYLLRGVAALAR